MRKLDRRDFDVIVLGSGLSGCFAACILARHGHRVLIIDKGTHPRFAIGESTIPQTSQLVQLVSRKFDVPELAVLGLRSPEGLREEVSPNSGIKRVVGFAYHRLGEEHRPEHGHHFGNVWRDENHLFRQDVDAWLLRIALGYGAHALQATAIDRVELDDAEARVTTGGGDTYSARFVIDASGFRSVLAGELGLREEPCSLRTHSRSIFTHVVGVRELEDVAPSFMAHRFAEGTLHHVFEGGWFWVIPFNNWEGAKNPIVSVGLTLDTRVYPKDPDLDAEEEFHSFLKRLPTVSKQFENAQPVRPWTRSGRIQYASTRTVGARWAMLSHAAGFVDPLYSRGLICTVESIEYLCDALLPALEDDDFTEERFAPVEEYGKRVLDFTDRVVSASYTSWADFDLWNLWVRVWAIGAHVVESHLGSILTVGRASWVEELDDHVFCKYEHKGYKLFFETMHDAMRRFEVGEVGAEEAKRMLGQTLAAYDFKIPLRDARQGQEWAMKTPLVRDIFLGVPERHERWVAELPDAALLSEAASTVA